MVLKIKIDSKEIVRDLTQAGSSLNKSFTLGLKTAATAIQREARIIHRYISRSGNLDRSISIQANKDLTADIFLDTGIAKYGPYQHNGTFSKLGRGIRPDPFIDIAAKNKTDDVIEILSRALTKGLKRAGLI